MKKTVFGIVLVMLVIGCGSQIKQESRVYEIERSKFINYTFSSDPLVEKTYVDCINNLSEDCKPIQGMTIKQFKELRALEFGWCKAKLDWRHSDGSEQWSEKFRYKNFTRVYTFEDGRLVEWMDVYSD